MTDESNTTRKRVNITAFRKRFAELLKGDKVIKMVITPEMAEHMLRHNVDNNRNIRPTKIEPFADDMRNGNWLMTGQGISFDTNGVLLDGQHRLTACVAAQRPFNSLVCFGVNPKSFLKVDTGAARTPGDAFSFRGIPYAVSVAAATRWIWSYERGYVKGSRRGTGMRTAATHEILLNYYTRKCRDVSDWIHVAEMVGNSRLLSKSTGLALMTLFARVDKDLAQQYMEGVFTGSNITKSDAAYVVRDRLITDLAKPYGRLSSVQRAAFLIKGWNALRKGKRLRMLTWGESEDFPKIQ